VKRQHAPALYIAHEPPTAKADLPPTYTLAEGATKIQCQMETEMNSDVPGVFTAKVTTHVYDTETGQYRSLSAALPDGRSVDLGKAPVTDNVGIMGLTGDVDHHFWRNLAAVPIAGTLRGGAQALQGNLVNLGGASHVAVGISASTSQYGQQAAGRAIDVRPTIRVHAGQPCTVILTKPLQLPAYRHL
jgi:type IV secretion system protein VirB10